MCWENLKSSRIYSTAAHTESIRWSVIVKMVSFQSHPNCVHLRRSQTMSFHQARSRLLHSRRCWSHCGHSETVACFSRLFSKGILRYSIRFFLCVFFTSCHISKGSVFVKAFCCQAPSSGEWVGNWSTIQTDEFKSVLLFCLKRTCLQKILNKIIWGNS